MFLKDGMGDRLKLRGCYVFTTTWAGVLWCANCPCATLRGEVTYLGGVNNFKDTRCVRA